MLGTLGYCARQLDIRAVKKFGLGTIEPNFKEESTDAEGGGASHKG